MRTASLLISVLMYLLTVFPSAAWTQSTKIAVSYAADSPSCLQVFTAKETGIFAKNGLDVQLIRIAGNVAVMSLMAGELPIIGQVGGSAVIASNLRGSDAVIIAAGAVASDYVLVSQPAIKSADQLRGGVLGVTGLGGSSMLAMQFALRKLGVNLENVTIVAIGQAPDRLAALQTGRVQATLLTPPEWIMAEKDGFNVLTDVAELPFPYSTVATTRKFIRENQEVVKKYVKSQIEAVHLMKTDREAGLKLLAKFLRRKLDREILERTYDQSVMEKILPRKQYPDMAGIKTVLDMIPDRANVSKAKLEQFVDTRFVKELDESGYIDGLYKRAPKNSLR
jgi:NitT/TauT family transport system substrate-binding protein